MIAHLRFTLTLARRPRGELPRSTLAPKIPRWVLRQLSNTPGEPNCPGPRKCPNHFCKVRAR
eukprot:13443422-Alexandrium_andersonii.AAC.1